MTVFRTEKTKNYTVMSILHLRDKRLSLKAKGLLSMMLSFPENWKYTEKGLAKVSKEKVDAVKTALHELEEAGYLSRTMERDNKGRYKNADYTIKEKPIYIPEELKKWLDQLPVAENPITEKPLTVKPVAENPLAAKPVTEKHTESNIYVAPKRSKESSIYQSRAKMEEVRAQIKDAIDYEILIEDYEESDLDLIVKVMTETLLTSKPYIAINGEECDTEIVKEAMLKIGSEHIRYVLANIAAAALDVKNVSGYIRTCLYNAVSAMDMHYKIKANHDLKKGAYSRVINLLNDGDVDDDL